MKISIEDFLKLDIRTGTVKKAQIFEGAKKPAIKLWIDFGEDIGERKSSAQITKHYTPETLIGRQVMAVINFPPRQIANFMSEVLVLGVSDENDDIVLLKPDMNVPNGQKMH